MVTALKLIFVTVFLVTIVSTVWMMVALDLSDIFPEVWYPMILCVVYLIWDRIIYRAIFKKLTGMTVEQERNQRELREL